MSQLPQSPRRPKGVITPLAINFLHLRNPYTIAWWSAAYPGFGHISLGCYVRGFLLFIWEILTNTQAKLNMAILYSFTGRFDLAKEIIDTRWLLLYPSVFIFSIWDSYRLTMKLNRLAVLADRNEEVIRPVSMSGMEINILDKRSPWVAAAWSLLGPGLGHLYTHQIPTGFFLLVWWITIAYCSNLLQAVHFTAFGLFEQTGAVVDPQWLLSLPSVYGFAVYDSYVNTNEYNRLFEKEQAVLFKQQYQSPDFKMPTQLASEVYITASFSYSIALEVVISELEQRGISREHICAIPMNVPWKERQLIDTIYQADGLSMFDLATVLGTIFMLFGVMWGFFWQWGPIIWGLIGLLLGGALGFLFKYLYYRLYMQKQPPSGKITEVVLIVSCREPEASMVEKVLAANLALSIGRKE
ncbi:hypothetical protein [Acetonema longum]|uniref:Membrane protein n=1 Tax=Acetonema longum DSM 6540 TaxID=1009370 RepID=F7NJ52_9FIRM|nr:hypothetical protein [Acetonema longum]EGO63942.1 membrane protein [Acetonema longum DSM 6540]